MGMRLGGEGVRGEKVGMRLGGEGVRGEKVGMSLGGEGVRGEKYCPCGCQDVEGECKGEREVAGDTSIVYTPTCCCLCTRLKLSYLII